ncbi:MULTISPECIES: hypothetical protein [Dactylosporangium]|uniref:Uncharacterized protein n=2 Tax=Dactylosporangium TaxID=35753 RepID=A0A9W6NQ77_9ACTN|nr:MULTISPECIES: hypothetical protein [Dactylosporangium]UAB92530.1 hypothetical protein Dvina_29770 [Dactylosporangium vinaceum]UWZ40981.1 hypothetical protein Dmats_24965 [Dactylosporangium matsuzakiense]GLL04812.1 hypothetical protein GCM10017581_065590 [Dactylosporangium matsuzakiense]
MGMHHGYLAATASGSGLLAALGRHCGDFFPGAPVADPDDLDLDGGDGGWGLALEEWPHYAILLDTSLLLADAPTLVVELSRELGTAVGCMAETLSGAYSLTAARDGRLLRQVSVQAGAEIVAVGPPLPTEAARPITDPDGDGLEAALEYLGFAMHGSAVIRPVRYTAARLPQPKPAATVTGRARVEPRR